MAKAYSGADMRLESGATWQDSAEEQLRAVCRAQQHEIDRLRAHVDELRKKLVARERMARIA